SCCDRPHTSHATRHVCSLSLQSHGDHQDLHFSLHDALPILTINPGEIVCLVGESGSGKSLSAGAIMRLLPEPHVRVTHGTIRLRSEEHTSELQSRENLVCRLLLEKKKKKMIRQRVDTASSSR